MSTSYLSALRTSQILDDFTAELKEGGGVKDYLLQPVECLFCWAQQLFSCPTDIHVRNLQPLQSAFAIPSLLSNVGAARTTYQRYVSPDNKGAVKATDFCKNLALCGANASEIPMFLHSVKIITLNSLKCLNTIFWGSLIIFDGINLKDNWTIANDLQAKLGDRTYDKSMTQHRLQLTYFSILQSISTLAMGAIALISCFFSSIAHGFLFSPVAFLTLATSWVVLNYTTYFYSKVIEQWDKPRAT